MSSKQRHTLYLVASVLMAVSKTVHATSVLPTVSESIIDSNPRDGISESINVCPNVRCSYIRNEVVALEVENRAIAEFDVTDFRGVILTQAILNFSLGAIGTGLITNFEVTIYSGNGIAGLDDFNKPGTSAGNVIFDPLQTNNFNLDVHSLVQSILDGGGIGAFVGVRVHMIDEQNHFDGAFIGTLDEVSMTLSQTSQGDFNMDGRVDGADFLYWQRNDGTAAGLALWENNFGTSASLTSEAVESFPEPSSTALAILCLCIGYGCRRLSHI